MPPGMKQSKNYPGVANSIFHLALAGCPPVGQERMLALGRGGPTYREGEP